MIQLDTRQLGATGITVPSLVEQGLLTGKYRAGDKTYVPSGPRRFMPAYSTRRLRKIEPLLQEMEHIAKAHDKTLA